MMSSPLDSSQPPLKKQKVVAQSTEEPATQSFQLTQNELLQLSQNMISSSPSISSSNTQQVVIKKGDKMSRKIRYLLKVVTEENRQVMLVSSGDAIQKLLSIIEILKLKLHDLEDNYEQYNRLDKYETFIKKNEILKKKRMVPVFYTLIRKEDASIKQGKEWTRQKI